MWFPERRQFKLLRGGGGGGTGGGSGSPIAIPNEQCCGPCGTEATGEDLTVQVVSYGGNTYPARIRMWFPVLYCCDNSLNQGAIATVPFDTGTGVYEEEYICGGASGTITIELDPATGILTATHSVEGLVAQYEPAGSFNLLCPTTFYLDESTTSSSNIDCKNCTVALCVSPVFGSLTECTLCPGDGGVGPSSATISATFTDGPSAGGCPASGLALVSPDPVSLNFETCSVTAGDVQSATFNPGPPPFYTPCQWIQWQMNLVHRVSDGYVKCSVLLTVYKYNGANATIEQDSVIAYDSPYQASCFGSFVCTNPGPAPLYGVKQWVTYPLSVTVVTS